MEELEIRLNGRVQGINLRRFIKSYADKNKLKGFVLNRVDGSVEIVAQGGKKELNDFLSWLQNSPGFSKIQGMTYNWRKISQTFDNFSIIKDSSFFKDQAKSFFNLGRTLLSKKIGKVPEHIAIIPDGNRRWAKKKGLEGGFGHYSAASFQHLRELFNECRKLGVKYLTLWGFSTENWKRSQGEINALFKLIGNGVEQFREDAEANKIRFRHIGRKDRLPKELLSALESLEKETENYKDFNVELCLDYGGRDELIRGVKKIMESGVKNIDEETFAKSLDFADVPDVDLIIRTSGENRLSGFMPFNSGYAELYFTEMHFPDFDARELRKAVEEFSRRQRRFGG